MINHPCQLSGLAISFNKYIHHIGGMIVSALASSAAVDRGFETRSCQTKDYKIGICCFTVKNATLR